jgi:hypothetical protein
MSIFEFPAAVRSDADEPTVEDEAPSRGFDPRSVQIAAAITAALVMLGLIVSNMAKPDAGVRPVLTSRSGPGAAAIEEVERSPAPAEDSAAPANVNEDEPTSDEPATTDSDTSPVRQQPDAGRSPDGKWDRHPGKGHGPRR